MPTLRVGGGTIPVGSKFTQNLAFGQLVSANPDIGTDTDGFKPPRGMDVATRAPAFAGQWYTIPANWLAFTYDPGFGVTFFGKLDDGTFVEIPDSDVEASVPQRNRALWGRDNEGMFQVEEDGTVKLTPETAAFLLDGKLITKKEFDAVANDKTNTQTSLPGAVHHASTALIVLALVVAAIYFIPRTGGA